MIPIPFSTVVKESGGAFFGDPALLTQTVTDICINSRLIGPGEVYVPVQGARFDGHAFIEDARQNGALCVFSEHKLEKEPYLLVPDAVLALQNVASYYRGLFPIPLVGVTGSMGKTSVKEMIAAVLATKFCVHKSQGNKNNQTGVPLMLFTLDPTHEISVMELGTNHFGEIRALSRMTRPDICVFTNIGVSHIENFASREGILQGKMEMLEYQAKGGCTIVNGDDDMLCRIPNTVTFGYGAENDVRATDVEDLGLAGMAFTVHCRAGSARIEIHAPGRTMVPNALAAIAVGLELGIPLSLLKESLAAYAAPAGRMDVRHCERYTIIDDTYNSNPTSVMAAIDVLEKAAGRRVCILGDMLELGHDSADFHEVTGMYAAMHGADLILCVGPNSEQTFYGAHSIHPDRTRYFSSQESLQRLLPGLLEDGDTILVKASRGMCMEDTVRLLMGGQTVKTEH